MQSLWRGVPLLRTVNQLHSTHTPKPEFNFGLRQTDRFGANRQIWSKQWNSCWRPVGKNLFTYCVCIHSVYTHCRPCCLHMCRICFREPVWPSLSWRRFLSRWVNITQFCLYWVCQELIFRLKYLCNFDLLIFSHFFENCATLSHQAYSIQQKTKKFLRNITN